MDRPERAKPPKDFSGNTQDWNAIVDIHYDTPNFVLGFMKLIDNLSEEISNLDVGQVLNTNKTDNNIKYDIGVDRKLNLYVYYNKEWNKQ